MQKIHKILTGIVGSLLTLGMTGLVLGGIITFLMLHHYSRNLPDYSQLANYDPATVSRLYTADGRLLEEYAVEKRVFVPLHAIPKRLIHAFIAAEDKNFFEHTGVDIYGIARAVITNINNFGHSRSLVGGSTITQQVVKNFLLSNEKSIERKIREAILAFRISRVFSKERILELYLNEIYLGMGSYGIAAASLNYFNKPLEELSIDEAAFLAGLPKAPSTYDPRRNYEAAKARRNYVLSRMEEDGYITAEEAVQAREREIILRQRRATQKVNAEFFAEEVRRKLIDDYGYDTLYKGGLFVRTTLVPELQEIADKALRHALIAYDKRHGYRGAIDRFSTMEGWRDRLAAYPTQKLPIFAKQSLAVVLEAGDKYARIGLADGSTGYIPLSDVKWAWRRGRGGAVTATADVFSRGDIIIAEESAESTPERRIFSLIQIPEANGALLAMDPHSGRILAMSGGYSAANTEFNRATQAKRQPGSAFKPFVYLAGLEKGLTPATIIIDGPIEISQGEGLPVWRPQNYSGDFLGPVTLRKGIEKSRNAMTVRLAQVVGLDKILEIGKRFGIYDNVPKRFSMVLGAYETTLLKLVNAYAMLVSGGKRVTPAIIERIDDKHGKTIYRRDRRKCDGCTDPDGNGDIDVAPPSLHDNREQIVDPRTAYQMVYMLQGVVERGTGVRAKKVGRPLAGKTGTTNDSRDTWFIGFSPNLVAGIYIGFDTPKSLGRKETGSNVALPGFVEFMAQALKDKPSTPFRIPSGIRMVKINPETGRPPQPDDSKIIWEAFKTEDNTGGSRIDDTNFSSWDGTTVVQSPAAVEGEEKTYYWHRDFPQGRSPSGYDRYDRTTTGDGRYNGYRNRSGNSRYIAPTPPRHYEGADSPWRSLPTQQPGYDSQQKQEYDSKPVPSASDMGTGGIY